MSSIRRISHALDMAAAPPSPITVSMPGSFSFRLRAFGCVIQAEASCSDSRAVLERSVFPALPRSAAAADVPDLRLRIRSGPDGFELSVNAVPVASASCAADLSPEVVRAIDEQILQRMKGMRAVHAGAVAWGDRALLLPGLTHAGKSSLVAELLRHGATYFSDEYALVDRDGLVHPYPRPLLLRNGSPRQSPVLPEECNAQAGTNPAKIDWILALQYQPAGAWNIAPVPQSQGVMTLLCNTPHRWTESPDLVSIFGKAVSRARCFTGIRGEAGTAALEILRLTGI